jgi:sugar O-acyltransferase (sialic acid O-acetyltransferase NeuD family)
MARVHPGSVVIFGGGGLGKCLIESLRGAGGELEPFCVVDDGLPAGSRVLDVPVVGGRAQLPALVAAGVGLAANGVGAIGRMQLRIDIFDLLAQAGLRAATVIDRDASIAQSARIGEGAQILPQAVVSADAGVGRGVIVNTSVVVSHDCRIGDYAHIAPGAILAGDVTVGEASLVGMGVTATLGLRIGARCVIGNGATLTGDVPDDTIVSAGTVWSG